jgi:hypothetical protein
MNLKVKIIKKLVSDRYRDMPPLEVALLFEKLLPEDKVAATSAILLNDNTVAKEKIMKYMESELDPLITSYINIGSIPITIVEELLS